LIGTQQGIWDRTWIIGKMQIPHNSRLAGSSSAKQKPLPKPLAMSQSAYLKVEDQKAAESKSTGETWTGDFPQALRSYVQRCFERCKTDDQRKAIEGALQEVSVRSGDVNAHA
jgi:hypothetical protein